jgi:hypothetical protein
MFKSFLSVIVGICCAIIISDLALRVVMTPYGGKVYSWGRKIVQFQEGRSRATFGPDGRRLTGAGLQAKGKNVLLIGDSHVEGLSVDDSATMGAVLERLLRTSVGPTNVAVYGWGGSAAPQFCATGPNLSKQMAP